MNHSPENAPSGNAKESGIAARRGGRPRVGKKSAGSIAIVVLAALYTFLQPHLNQQFGWNLPGLKKGNTSSTATAEGAGSGGDTLVGSATETNDALVATKSDGAAKYGLLREISADRYMSPEGLQYTPGSAEGHRLEHLRRHTDDLPSRSGSHGVFDGGMEGALKTIDRAYARAKKNQKTTKKTDKGRTIYTVDMGGRVGFVGGRDGNRKRKPMARRVRLVLEGTRVITAYPMN